jgi:uncharacterized damage-inducible protein DinB
MSRNSIMALLTAVASACALPAQGADPFSTEIKQMYDHVKNNLTKMAEKMPEEHYSFRPTSEIRTFAQIVAHVADVQARSCSAVNRGSTSLNVSSKTTKADLVAALKESFSLCDQAFGSLTDATTLDMVTWPEGQHHSKAGVLIMAIVSHSNEEYGYMAVYLRLKGIVPPSSEGR